MYITCVLLVIMIFFSDINNECDILKQINNLLTKFNIPSQDITNIIKSIKSLHTSEIQQIKEQHFNELLRYKNKVRKKENAVKTISNKYKHLEQNSTEYDCLRDARILSVKKVENSTFEKPVDQIELKCSLLHCEEICKTNFDKIEKLEKENFNLKNENIDLMAMNKQKEKELSKLSENYNNLFSAFMNCQNKIWLLCSRLNQGNAALPAQETSEDSISKGKCFMVCFFSFLSL